MTDPGPRIVFERPSFSRWGVRVSMSILGAVVVGLLVSSWSVEARVGLWTLVVLSAPFLLTVWYRVAQRVELDAAGITVVNRLGSRHTPWSAAAGVQLPGYNWNDHVVPMPAGLDGIEPAFALEPPKDSRTDDRHALRLIAFGRLRDGWYFRLYLALIALRTAEPDADWRAQLVTVFRARAAHNRTSAAAALPPARVA